MNSNRAFVAVVLISSLACGGGGGNTATGPTDVIVAVDPAAVDVGVGETRRFTASVSGSASGVTWSVVDSSRCGSIDAGGLYAAPQSVPWLPFTCRVRATSVADASKTFDVTVNLTCAEHLPTSDPFVGVPVAQASTALKPLFATDGRMLVPFAADGAMKARVWSGSAWETRTIVPAGMTQFGGAPVFAESAGGRFVAFTLSGSSTLPLVPRVYRELPDGSFADPVVLPGLPAGALVRSFARSERYDRELVISVAGNPLVTRASERAGSGEFAQPTVVHDGTDGAIGAEAAFLADGSPLVVLWSAKAIRFKHRAGALWTEIPMNGAAADDQTTFKSVKIAAPMTMSLPDGTAIPVLFGVVEAVTTTADGPFVVSSLFMVPAGDMPSRLDLTEVHRVPQTGAGVSLAASGVFAYVSGRAPGLAFLFDVREASSGAVRLGTVATAAVSEAFLPSLVFGDLPTLAVGGRCGTPLIAYKAYDPASPASGLPTVVEPLRIQAFDGMPGN